MIYMKMSSHSLSSSQLCRVVLKIIINVGTTKRKVSCHPNAILNCSILLIYEWEFKYCDDDDTTPEKYSQNIWLLVGIIVHVTLLSYIASSSFVTTKTNKQMEGNYNAGLFTELTTHLYGVPLKMRKLKFQQQKHTVSCRINERLC